jgi:hypothetical protein
VLFGAGYLSTVLGVRLTSGVQVVIKIRPAADRLAGCAAVHRRLFERGFPCPEPLVDLEPLDDFVASADAMVTGGDPCPRSGRSPEPFARALARLVALAPSPSEVSSLNPAPPWAAPDFAAPGVWPDPDARGVDLNAAALPGWLDEAGRFARSTLAASRAPLVVGHGDWYTGNLRWTRDRLHTVWDWDSAMAAPEPAIAGLAAAVYPAPDAGKLATVAESEAVLAAYQQVRGPFSDAGVAEAWAAGLWTRSFEAATEREPGWLTEAEARERRRRVEGL